MAVSIKLMLNRAPSLYPLKTAQKPEKRMRNALARQLGRDAAARSRDARDVLRGARAGLPGQDETRATLSLYTAIGSHSLGIYIVILL